MSLKDDSYERQPEMIVSVHTYCTRDSSCVGSDIRNYRQLECEHLYSVDRLNTEGGRDFASQLMHGYSHLLFL